MSTPFIGSRISLISKSDVRYEGKLCGIDTNESKVYLQHVRCFGTEDRRKENPIAASTEIYDVIIFHSSDIKDLSVCELPSVYEPMNFNSFSPMGGYPPQYGYHMMNPQYGPQYGQMYPPYPSYNNYGMYSQMMPQDMNSPYAHPHSQPPHHPPPITPDATQYQQPQKINVTTSKVSDSEGSSTDQGELASESSAGTSGSNEGTSGLSAENNQVEGNESSQAQVTSNVNSNNAQNSQASEDHKPHKSSNNKNNFYNKKPNYKNYNNNGKSYYNKKNNAPAQANDENNRSNQNAEQISSISETPKDAEQFSAENNSSNEQSSQHDNNTSNNQSRRYEGGHNNNNDRQGRGNKRGFKYYNRRGSYDSRGHNNNNHSHNNYTSQPNPPHSQNFSHKSKSDQPKDDFDFQSANSKFQKLSLTDEAEKELPKVATTYSKDAFYDTISCDTLDRLEENSDKKTFYEQRKLDSETFGDIARRNNNNRGHTRGRYESHSQNNNNQKRYNNNSGNNRNNNYRNFRGNKNGSNNYQNKEKNSPVAQE